jgi:hypothetical protein
MIDEKSLRAILYLAIPELLFAVVISFIAAVKLQEASISEVYSYVESFLTEFFYTSVSLTFDSILIVTLVSFVLQLIAKNHIKYGRIFSLGVYASTLPLILKYIMFIIAYVAGFGIKFFKFIYIPIFIFYFIKNYKAIFNIKEGKKKK